MEPAVEETRAPLSSLTTRCSLDATWSYPKMEAGPVVPAQVSQASIQEEGEEPEPQAVTPSCPPPRS